MKKYDWAVVGSGIAGISIAEILSREGHSVILIEKNDKLASETTRGFHEWLHTGALYTLVPDGLKTLRFILGAIDDLIEFYSSYDNMNLLPTSSGLKINNIKNGWFNNNFIHFKYRTKNRKLTFPWLIGIARSIFLIEKIHKHDWLRRRAGEIELFKVDRTKRILSLFKELLVSKEEFKEIKTPDFTINSRILLRDMVETAIKNGMDFSLNNKIKKIKTKNNLKEIIGSKETFYAENIALCNGSSIKDFTNVKTKTSYAPIAVVDGLEKETKSFVELDYFPKNCINLLTKKDGMGLAGGISMSDKLKCDNYLDQVLSKLKDKDSKINELSRYIGVKTELTFKNQPRGYLYHIVNTNPGVWSIVPGKFTLGFSLAPEFYRRIYNKNPKKNHNTVKSDGDINSIVSNTVWEDDLKKKRENNGIN